MQGIIFTANRNGDNEICKIGDDGIVQQITDNPYDDFGPACSPNGTMVAFFSAESNEIYVTVLNFKNASVVSKTKINTQWAIVPFILQWSADSSKIAIEYEDGSQPLDASGMFYAHNISILDVRYGTILVSTTGDYNAVLEWSPTDSNELMFDSVQNISVMNVQTGVSKIIGPSGNGWPKWSPDGKLVAFPFNNNGQKEIRIINFSSGEEVCRILTEEMPFSLEWSPDNRKLAFVQDNYLDVSKHDIYIAQEDGSGSWKAVRLSDRGLLERNIQWSPDGTMLAFVAAPDDSTSWDRDQVYIADSTSLQINTITKGSYGYDYAGRISNLCWSPDGKDLLFTTSKNNLYDIDVEAGTGETLLTTFAGSAYGVQYNVDWIPKTSVPNPTFSDLAQLSDFVYNDHKIGDICGEWTVIDVSDPSGGFYGEALKNGSTIVFAFKGLADKSLLDLSSDMKRLLILAGTSLQLGDAQNFVMKNLYEPNNIGCNFVLTGHDIGGSLAQLVSVGLSNGKFIGLSGYTPDGCMDVPTVTFNAIGIADPIITKVLWGYLFGKLSSLIVKNMPAIWIDSIEILTGPLPEKFKTFLAEKIVGYGLDKVGEVVSDFIAEYTKFSIGADLLNLEKYSFILNLTTSTNFGVSINKNVGPTIPIPTKIVNGEYFEGYKFSDGVAQSDMGNFIEFFRDFGLQYPEYVKVGGVIENGSTYDDLLIGQAGYNPLNGLSGNDILVDGFTYSFWSGDYDPVNLNGGDGNDMLIGGLNPDGPINGGDGNDILFGSGKLNGEDGNDQIFGIDFAEYNELNGGKGNDYLQGGRLTTNSLYGGDGNDTLVGIVNSDNYYSGGLGEDIYFIPSCKIIGNKILKNIILNQDNGDSVRSFAKVLSVSAISAAADKIVFTGNANFFDFLFQPIGNDLMINLGENNTLIIEEWNTSEESKIAKFETDNGSSLSLSEGSLGDDLLFGYDGSDTIDGLGGNDYLVGGNDADYLLGGDGNDILDGGDGNDTLLGGDGNDFIIYDPEDLNQNVSGGEGRDTIDASRLSVGIFMNLVSDYTDFECINGSTGNDTLLGNGYDNYLQGNAGNDVLNGGNGEDTLFGGENDDTLYGETGNDVIDGIAGDGKDMVYGGDGNDTIYGYSQDTLYGGEGEDFIYSADGNACLYGEAGNDNLYGGLGSDILYGGSGNDVLQGGFGSGMLFGDDGDDILFASNSSAEAYDLIFASVSIYGDI